MSRKRLFIIPESFASFTIEMFGAEGRAWLDRLPALLATYEERWQLTIGAPFHNLSFNYVAPAVRADGTQTIVKTGLTNEFPAQPEALRHFAGHGMVSLLAYEEQDAIMLLERLQPGLSLRTVTNDEDAISAMADVMRKLWRPLPSKHFPFSTVSDWGEGFVRIGTLLGNSSGPLSAATLDRAQQLYMELSASMAEPVLLHGDLHQDNILAAEREPWLAVDPKGVIGEPAYETGAVLRNFWPDILSIPDSKTLMKRRIDQLSSELGFARERIYNWGFAQAVLAVLWSFEDTGKLAPEGLYFVELLDAIKP